jgi:hypothetical protein
VIHENKMAIDSTDPEITTPKKNHDLLERDMERDEDDDFVVLKSLLPDIKSLP